MKQYIVTHVRNLNSLGEEMNVFAQQGWVLKQAISSNGRWTVILEREVNPEDVAPFSEEEVKATKVKKNAR